VEAGAVGGESEPAGRQPRSSRLDVAATQCGDEPGRQGLGGAGGTADAAMAGVTGAAAVGFDVCHRPAGLAVPVKQQHIYTGHARAPAREQEQEY
jgi:hypothetical protein